MGTIGLMGNPPPEILYHYTDGTALKSILSNKELWASNVHFLNDYKEYQLAFDNVVKEFENVSMGTIIEDSRMHGNLQSLKDANIYVSSFSKHPDLLSQWRGYTGGNQGFAIGFDFKKMGTLASNAGLLLAECIYKPDIQIQMAKEMKQMIIKSHDPLVVRDLSYRNPQIYQFICKSFPLFKESSFKEESEWRFITPIIADNDDRIDFRIKGNLIIPFYKINFREYCKENIISEILIGPGPHKNLCDAALSIMLRRYDYSNVGIRSSGIPFRNW